MKSQFVDVSIIIVSYNTKNLLKNCIESIYQHTKDIVYELFVVDNCSSDGSVEMVKAFFPKVVLISNRKNVGFAAANNIGISIANGKYFMFLNPDTVILNNSINIFYQFIESRKSQKIGACGSVLLDEKQMPSKSYGFNPTFENVLKRMYAAQFMRIFRVFRVRRRKEKTKKIEKPFIVDYISGADLFVPRKVIDDIGYFDENFFIYAEEADLQYRMSIRDYKRYIIPGPKIVHFQRKSFKTLNIQRIRKNEGYLNFLNKYNSNIPSLFIFKVFFLIGILVEVMIDMLMLKYNLKECASYLRKGFLLRSYACE